MSIELDKLNGKKLLVVESEDKAFRRGLTSFIHSLSGANVIYDYNVPRDLTQLFLVDGIDACLIHSPDLNGDIDTIIEIKRMSVPTVILTSLAYRERDAHSKERIESAGIITVEKTIGMDCYKQALKLLSDEFNN